MRNLPGLLEETAALTDNRDPMSIASTTVNSEGSLSGYGHGNLSLSRNISDARSVTAESIGPSPVFRESSEVSQKPDEVTILKGTETSDPSKEINTLSQVLPTGADLQDRLKSAIEASAKDGNMERVRQVLADGADINGDMKYKRGLFFTGTALTLAAKLGNKDLIIFLIENNADPDSHYSMKAGAEQVINSIPAAGATIVGKKLGLLRLLHEKKATLQGRTMSFNGEPNGTLLYEACYVGCVSIMRFLLRRCKQDLEKAVKFQDDLRVTMTPLHVAALRGNFEVVEDLLKIGAKIGPSDETGRGPPILADTIDEGWVNICRLLVKSSADIFGGEYGRRGIDYIFNTNDILIIAAVAAGLGASTDANCVKGMKPEDLVNFMRVANCDEIFDAIFQEKKLEDWCGRKRIHWHNAYISNNTFKVNIAEGPSHHELTDLFNQRKALAADVQDKMLHSIYDDDPYIQAFMDSLMPKRTKGKQKRRIVQVPVETRQCVMSDIHNNVKVVWALANGPNLTAFDHQGAQALVMYGWNKTEYWYTLNFVWSFILALIFLFMAYIIRNDAPAEWRYVLGSVATLILVRQVFYEVMQMVGLCMLGHLTSYVTDWNNIVDMVRLLLTAFSIIMFFNAEGFEVKDTMEIRIFMGLVMFLLWNKLLLSQRGFAIAGQKMLPILETFESIWPFLTVMIWPTIGFANCYYMVSPYDEFHRAFTMVYRMGWLGDFDLEEVEDIDPSFEPTEGFPSEEGSVLETVDPVFTEFHYVFVIFLLVVTIMFTIIMMNILIGVLSESYSFAYSNKHRIFLKQRARLNFEHYAVSWALHKLFGGCSCLERCCRRNKVARNSLSHWGGRTTQEGEKIHLWYCRPKNMDELGLPDEDDDDNTGGADNVHDLLKLVLNDLASFKVEFNTRMDDVETRSFKHHNGKSSGQKTVADMVKHLTDGLDELKEELRGMDGAGQGY